MCSVIVTIATGIIIIATSKLNSGFECKKAKLGISNQLASRTGVKSTKPKPIADK